MLFSHSNPEADASPDVPASDTEDTFTSTAAETTASAQDASVSFEQEYATLKDQYLRLAADFDNFRKRTQEDRRNWSKYGAENTLQELLPTLDNLERAAQSLSEQSDPKLLYQSFKLVYQQMLEALSSSGLQKMASNGQLFDPSFHEAMAQQETDDHPEGAILEVAQSGYLLHDRVIRPAKVLVATPKQNTPPNTPTPSGGNPFSQADTTHSDFSPDTP